MAGEPREIEEVEELDEELDPEGEPESTPAAPDAGGGGVGF
jgi:hypothetical protein